jgi:transcriptional regulator with XRE-family HTH domain
MGKLVNRIPELLARKDIRDKKRYSQRDMARGTGLSDNAISRLMRYKTLDNIPLHAILALADWLGIDNPRELVEVSDTDISNSNET